MIFDDAPTRHPQVRIKLVDEEADVDEEIAELILVIWKAGMRTFCSCQDHDSDDVRRVQVGLFADDAEEFLSIIADPYDSDPSGLYMRAVGGVSEGGWGFEFSMGDEATVEQAGADVRFRVFLDFPFDDVPEVIGRLHRHMDWT